MLTVTDAASARLAELIEREGLPDDTAIRFIYDGQGLAMQPDKPRPGDETFDHEGRDVLLLDTQMAELLGSHTLDVEGENLALRSEGDEAEGEQQS